MAVIGATDNPSSVGRTILWNLINTEPFVNTLGALSYELAVPFAALQRASFRRGAPVAGMFAHSDEMLELPSGGVFALRYPEHEFSRGVGRMALGLIGAS